MNKKSSAIAFQVIALFSLLFFSCKKEEAVEKAPVINMDGFDLRSATEVYLESYFNYEGNKRIITDHGFVWSTSPEPTIDSPGKKSLGKPEADGIFFRTKLDVLEPGTTYFVRSYVVGDKLVTYGKELIVATPLTKINSITPYSVVQSGSWTLENTDPGTYFTHIHIEGSGFTRIAVKNIVKINDVQVEVLPDSTGIIKAIIPAHFKDSITVSVTTGSRTVVADQKAFIHSGKWIQKADLSKNISSAASFTIGEKAYIVTGAGDGLQSISQEVWEYDVQTNLWSRKADYPGKQGIKSVAFSIGSVGYVIFPAMQNGVYSKEFWAYDARVNTWYRKADFPGAERNFAVGTTIGEKGYVGMGMNMYYLKDFWEYDPTRDAWTRMADYPGYGGSDMSMFSIAGTDKAYSVYRRYVYEYNASTNQWRRKNDFPGTERENGLAFTIGNKGYYGTGTTNCWEHCSSDIWEYNPTQDNWIRKVNLPVYRYNASGFFALGGAKAYIMGGKDKYSSAQNDLWEFTPDLR